jgi:hypothetical protein
MGRISDNGLPHVLGNVNAVFFVGLQSQARLSITKTRRQRRTVSFLCGQMRAALASDVTTSFGAPFLPPPASAGPSSIIIGSSAVPLPEAAAAEDGPLEPVEVGCRKPDREVCTGPPAPAAPAPASGFRATAFASCAFLARSQDLER